SSRGFGVTTPVCPCPDFPECPAWRAGLAFIVDCTEKLPPKDFCSPLHKDYEELGGIEAASQGIREEVYGTSLKRGVRIRQNAATCTPPGIGDCGLRIADGELRTADWGLRIAN